MQTRAYYWCTISLLVQQTSHNLVSVFIKARSAFRSRSPGDIFISRTLSSPFLRAKAATALARLSHRNSVCVSGWISEKRFTLGSPNLHRRLLERL